MENMDSPPSSCEDRSCSANRDGEDGTLRLALRREGRVADRLSARAAIHLCPLIGILYALNYPRQHNLHARHQLFARRKKRTTGPVDKSSLLVEIIVAADNADTDNCQATGNPAPPSSSGPGP